jgi:hypothetical protein
MMLAAPTNIKANGKTRTKNMKGEGKDNSENKEEEKKTEFKTERYMIRVGD